MTNAYTDKPFLPYMRTSVEMGAVVKYLQGLAVPAEVKRAAYIMFRNESGNGRSGVNNNYAGVQADGARWPEKWDNRIQGVVKKGENGTGNQRLFVAFGSWQDSVDFLVDRVEQRGLYVGGTPHLILHMRIDNEVELSDAYLKEWVHGSAKYMPTDKERNNFASMYKQSKELFL
ncbi:hypothetical protein DCC81_11870 [Chitinophaga parva]|uniref:Uncharacterized protein n=1 Tax=Chitinophaga parva TaxID=2169414 RepID=A0A2T7BFF4_9BACT|nr:hypothetical protein [Chitinophaga parva]PUZ25004.1 hypothetical protein DCC81_11870 [Chitinophaga parva]